MFAAGSSLSTMQVCYLLGIYPNTLMNWYKYINKTDPADLPKDCPGLPPYTQSHKGGKKFWSPSDLHQLYAFKQWVPKGRGGVMSEISKDYWCQKEKERYLNTQSLLNSN